MLCEMVFSDRLNTNPLESCNAKLDKCQASCKRLSVLVSEPQFWFRLSAPARRNESLLFVSKRSTPKQKRRMTGYAYKAKEIRKSDPQVFPHGLKILLCNLRTSTAHLVVRYVVAEANFLPQPADRIRGAQARETPTLRVPPFLEAGMARRWFSRNRNMTLASLEWEEVA